MKKNLLFLTCLFLSPLLKAQTSDYDTAAIMILDRMSDVIGDLSSCSFTLDVASDQLDTGIVNTAFSRSEVMMVGPDKMSVNTAGTNGHKEYFYNGKTITFYSFNENNYAVVDAPSNIVDAIDSVHDIYGIDFPAADFFYPTFSDDVLANFDAIDFLGIETVNGTECFDILAKGKDKDVQLWIANDATTLPVRFIISYKNDKTIKRYDASFSNWKLNPDLPTSSFEFPMPPNAHEVTLMPLSSN